MTQLSQPTEVIAGAGNHSRVELPAPRTSAHERIDGRLAFGPEHVETRLRGWCGGGELSVDCSEALGGGQD
jgi:hypothetical protein